MDVIMSIERPGYHIDEKKHAQSESWEKSPVSPEESIAYIQKTYGIEIGETMSEQKKRTTGPGSRACIRCGTHNGLIRRYGLIHL